MMQKIGVPCRVRSGLFSNEYAVTLQSKDGQDVELFADRDLITEKGKRSYLRVTFVKKTNALSSGSSTVLLPTEALNTGSPWIDVANDQLQPI